MDDQPTNRELMHFIKDIRDDVSEIKTQTQKTNGSVADLKKWKEQVIGGMKVFSIAVLPIVAWALWQISQLDSKVEAGAQRVLSEYSVQIKNGN